MERRYILSVALVFAVIAVLLTVFLTKIVSFRFMPFGFGGSKGMFGFVMLFGIAGILLWLTYSMWK